MAEGRLRVALDANVIIAGIRWPRWPYEVMQAAMRGYFDVVLPLQILEETRRHLDHPLEHAAFDVFLASTGCEEIPMPSRERVLENLDLVRSESDVPIALSLLDGEVDIFVTNDRDFTDAGATSERLHGKVRIMLTPVFLRAVIGWSPEGLEAIRNRQWRDIPEDPTPADP